MNCIQVGTLVWPATPGSMSKCDSQWGLRPVNSRGVSEVAKALADRDNHNRTIYNGIKFGIVYIVVPALLIFGLYVLSYFASSDRYNRTTGTQLALSRFSGTLTHYLELYRILSALKQFPR
jgi:hypothetical protein